jgi:hypothetical protein
MTRPLMALLLAALAGCETEPVREVQKLFQPTKAQQTLSAGLKHSAFIYCASSRERQRREEFKKALAIDPGLDLAPEEADHPMWGRVFRSVKAGR